MRRTTLLILLLLLALPAQTLGQKRNRSRTQKQPSPATKQTQPGFRPEAGQVAGQLKALARFLYLYGRISAALERADEQSKEGDIPPEIQAKTKESKSSVVSNISNLRAGLAKLEQTFHANPQLQVSYLKVLSASEAAATAEQLAAANRFDEAGRALLGVAERLADLLVEMR